MRGLKLPLVMLIVTAAPAVGAVDIEIEAAGYAQGFASDSDAVAPREGVWGGSGAGRVTVLPEWGNLSAVLTLEGWTGDGLRQDLSDPYLVTYVPVNADRAYRTNRAISEGYATLKLGETNFTLSAGRADVSRLFDTNPVATEPRTQFVNASFRRSAATEYPGGDDSPYTYAAWLTMKVPDLSDEQWGLGARIGWALMDEADDDPNNVMDGRPYYFGEVRLLRGRKFCASAFAWQATYPHTMHDSTSTETKEAGMGFGVSADWEPPGTNQLKLFFRSTLADQHIMPNTFKSTWSVGVEMTGRPWQRPQDYLAVAYGSNVLSEDYASDYLVQNPGADEPTNENVVEFYYQLVLVERTTEWPSIEITPSVQSIQGAGGTGEAASVYTIRLRSLYIF